MESADDLLGGMRDRVPKVNEVMSEQGQRDRDGLPRGRGQNRTLLRSGLQRVAEYDQPRRIAVIFMDLTFYFSLQNVAFL